MKNKFLLIAILIDSTFYLYISIGIVIVSFFAEFYQYTIPQAATFWGLGFLPIFFFKIKKELKKDDFIKDYREDFIKKNKDNNE